MRADDLKVVDPSARGRDSIRVTSTKAYNDSVIVLDVTHMPAGCATWPAFWTLTQSGPWPQGGEIDIIEGDFHTHLQCVISFAELCLGVNLQTSNLASLHTTSGCSMGALRLESG